MGKDPGAVSETGWLDRFAESSPILWLGFGSLILAIWLFFLIWLPLNMDVAWNLYLAERFLEGADLYTDYFETSPPMIHYLNLPAACAARFLSLPGVWAFHAFVALLCFLNILLSRRFLDQILVKPSPVTRRTLLLALMGVLFIWQLSEFGNRDHLMFVLALPYVWATIARSLGRKVRTDLALLVGLLAGLGLGIKPYFPILWVVMAAYLALTRKDFRELLRPENLAIAVVLCLYSAVVLIWERDYLEAVKLAMEAYGAYAEKFPVVVYKVARIWLFGLTAVILVRAPLGDSKVRLGLFSAATAFLVIALVQNRAWSYHMYPGEGVVIMLLVLTVLRLGESIGRLNRYIWQGLTSLAVIFLVGLCLKGPLIAYGAYLPEDRRQLSELTSLVRREARGKPIYFMSTHMSPAWPLVTQGGARWPYRFNMMIPIPTNYPRRDDPRSRQTPFHRLEEMSWSERSLVEAVVGGLKANPPVLLIVEEGPLVAGWQFNWLDYFGQDPDFVELMKSYRPLTKIGAYRVYKRE